MPVNVKFAEDGGIYIEGTGVFTDEDLATANNIVYRDDEHINKILYQVIDLSECEKVELSNSAINRAAELDQKALNINPKMRIAVLGDSELVFGLGRMWEVYACHFSDHENSCGVFRNREDIEKWVKSIK